MPKLFEYLGIVIFFWSDEHEPIHVHGRYSDTEIKAEIILEEGEIKEIKFKNISGKKKFDTSKRKDFEIFINHYAKEIVKSWADYFVWKKNIKPKSITRRLK